MLLWEPSSSIRGTNQTFDIRSVHKSQEGQEYDRGLQDFHQTGRRNLNELLGTSGQRGACSELTGIHGRHVWCDNDLL